MRAPLSRRDWHRVGLILSVGIALGMVAAPNRVWAQLPDSTVLSDSARRAALDSADILLAKADSIIAATKPYPTIYTAVVKVDHADRDATLAYAGMISAGLALNEWLKIDQDPCTNGHRVCFSTTAYHDVFTTHDKIDHANAAYFLTSSAIAGGVPSRWAFVLTCGLAGVGFEFTQGYVSRKDIVADCTGAGLAVLTRSISDKMHAQGWLRLRR